MFLFQNESILYKEKQELDGGATNAAFESESDSGVELSNINETEQTNGHVTETLEYVKLKNDTLQKETTTKQSNTVTKVCDEDLNNVTKETTYSPSSDKNANEIAKSKSEEIVIELENIVINKHGSSRDADRKKGRKLGHIREEDETDSSNTDSSYGDFEYERGDLDREVSATESSLSESTFKRSRSFGDRPTRRRLVSYTRQDLLPLYRGHASPRSRAVVMRACVLACVHV